jgi:hypothetical protein
LRTCPEEPPEALPGGIVNGPDSHFFCFSGPWGSAPQALFLLLWLGTAIVHILDSSAIL